MLRTRTWIIIIALIFISCGAVCLWQALRPAPGPTAEITVDGETVETIDLSAETATRTFTVETPWGTNTLEVGPNCLRVLDADCPDRVCVDTGWLTAGSPIVCLPHRLVIRLTGPGGGPDASVG